MYLQRQTPEVAFISMTDEICDVCTHIIKHFINKWHCLIGHPGVQVARDAAIVHQVSLTKQVFKICTACTEGKACQKNVPKKLRKAWMIIKIPDIIEDKTATTNHRFHLDMTII